MSILLLPSEIISEILIFTDNFKLCIQIKDNYSANKVYNKKYHSFNKICRKGDLEVLKWLFFNNKIDYTNTNNNIMDSASKYGHLDIVKFLHENRLEGCTTSAMNYASQNGYLEIVMFLHENRLEGCTTSAMDKAVLNRHLEVVKFLHENRLEGCTPIDFFI